MLLNMKTLHLLNKALLLHGQWLVLSPNPTGWIGQTLDLSCSLDFDVYNFGVLQNFSGDFPKLTNDQQVAAKTASAVKSL